MLREIEFGEPENVGELVRTRLGQAAEIGFRPGDGEEIYFASNGATAEFFCLDLRTGRCKFRSEIPGEDAIWGMAIGKDGCVYLAGGLSGVLFRYDPGRGQMEKVGVHPADPCVWDLKAFGDSVFGATYPKARIFEYDLTRSVFKDWGRADEESYYARGIAVDERFLYVGLGSTAGLVMVDRRDGRRTKIDLPGVTGKQGFLERLWVYGDHLVIYVQKSQTYVYDLKTQRVVDAFTSDGYVCADASNGGQPLYFTRGNVLYCWHGARSVSQVATLPMKARDKVKIKAMKWIDRQAGNPSGGRMLAMVTSYAECFLYDPLAGEVCAVDLEVPPKPVSVQALAFDGKNRLYVAGFQRGLTVWNTRERRVEWEMEHFPQTEGIGFDERGNVYFGTYTQAKIYRYDPERPFDPRLDADANPGYVFQIGEFQDRPFAVASGDGLVFFGTVPDYGLLDGALTVYRPATGEIRVYPGIVPQQSIISLAYREGLLYGGSSIWGGLGREPSQERAELFVWDARQGKLLERFRPDIPGIDVPPRMIGELAVGPDGLLWGIADGTVFAYDRFTMRLVKYRMIRPSTYKGSPFRPPVLRWGLDGLMYTTLARELIVIDPVTLDFRVIEEEKLELLTLGPDGDLYYARGPRLIRRKVTRPTDAANGRTAGQNRG